MSLGIFPVSFFLLSLIYLDSYKLVRLRVVLSTMVAGAATAGLSYFLHVVLITHMILDREDLPRYGAPAIEEILKALLLIYLIRSRRVGFLVDAAILGFALGTGFAVAENFYYLNVLSESPLMLWMIRGFGTAVMHPGTTAIFAVASKALGERYPESRILVFLPGLILAVGIHSFYNQFIVSPVVATVGILLILPASLLFVFNRSEKFLQEWMGSGFDTDTEVLQLIHSGRFTDSKIGRYLQSLRQRFPGEVVADMLCYLRLHLELSIRAKGILMIQEAGFAVPADPEVKEKLKELRYLESSIGKTGKLAMSPFLRTDSQDLWQLYLVGSH